MSAIAYITDSKMLELHRLNKHQSMNFWRLSNNLNFSDFSIGDLVFFLSKDKEHKNGKEKGIVGFGRVKAINLGSIKTMWDKHGILNGYNSFNEFDEAIIKVSKDKKLPKKISSFYLENVNFFQPIYLSECGMKISNNIESYIYLKPEEVVNNLFRLAKKSLDLWSGYDTKNIDNEEVLYDLYVAHKQIKDINLSEKQKKKAYKELKEYIKNNQNYQFVHNSKNEIYSINNRDINIIIYRDKDVDIKQIIGQIYLYKKKLKDKNINLSFNTIDNYLVDNNIL